MRTLIAVDGSDQAERVVAAAARLLREVEDVHVRLITVMDDSEVRATTAGGQRYEATPQGSLSGTYFHTSPPTPRFTEDRTQALARVHSDLEQRLEALAYLYLAKLDVHCCVVSSSHTVAEILESAKSFAADLLIVGTRGRRGVARVLMGSTAQGVVRKSPVPVLVIGDEVEGADPGPRT